MRQQPLLDLDDLFDLLAEIRPVQIAQANGVRTAVLVAIARADASIGRADALAAHGLAFIALSSAMCHGKTTCRRSLIRKLSVNRTPRAASESISCKAMGGLSTTPGPITFITPGLSTPLGIWCSLYTCPSTTTVWPALAPP